MKLHAYENYAAYRAIQTKANRAKIKFSWVRPATVDLVCERILTANPRPTFGLCHGTRRGEEQKLFAARLKCKVLGTEVSDTAAKFPNTIQWDFHQTKPEWIGACDFIYSNSLDHALDPKRALGAWLSCLTPTGLLVIEWIERFKRNKRKKSTEVDPFAATTAEVRHMIKELGGEVVEVVPLNYKKVSECKGVAHGAIIFARRKP